MATRSAAAREESWNSVHHSEVSNGDYEDDPMEGQEEPQLRTVGDVHRVLHPLQATAERVGKQVEKFAETLDRLGSKRDKPADDCRDVLPLVYEYERIASETVKQLRRYHEPERQERMKRTWKKRLNKSRRGSTPFEVHDDEIGNETSTTVEDLQHWEHERQTWQLLRLMLQVQHPTEGKIKGVPEEEERFRRPKDTPKVHQFSSERDVWNSYLEQNPDMWEKHVVVEWLKSSADSSGQDIDVVVEQLESGADRGSGLWAHSWLYSKEKIKANKRLRSWAQPLEPGSEGLDITLVSDDSEDLVTQLDPDAFSRQDRKLQREDIFFERAIWLACYEMIRRGHSWNAIREWCQERVEVWRALSMRGDPRLAEGASGSKDVLSGWQARSIWRKMCAIAAREGGIDEYENAVYGILSGSFSSVENVVRSWDDYLFAVYNTQLLEGFDFFTRRTFANSLPWDVLDKFSGPKFGDGVTRPILMGEDIWKELMEKELTREEAKSPIKMIQGSIIAKQLRKLLVNQGRLLAQRAAQKLGRRTPTAVRRPHGPHAEIVHEDYDLLRILTHMVFVQQTLEPMPMEGAAIENIVKAYVDYLGKAGKQQLLPLYASRLSEEGSVQCMAQQLPTIVEANERKTVLDLMGQYALDIPRILLEQLIVIIKDIPINHLPESGVPPRRFIGKPVPKGTENKKQTQPLLLDIIPGFMGDEISGEEQDLINGMEWYLLLSGHWNETMAAGVLVYKHLLRTGALAAARELLRRVPFAQISKNKTGDLIGKAVDLGVLSDDEGYDGITQDTTRPRHQRSKSQMDIEARKEYLLTSSLTFRELENMVFALDAIEGWRSVLEALHTHPNASHAKELKAELQQALELVIGYVDPILKTWLQSPRDDAEAKELHTLRRQYLPELVLAYNSVISISGQYLTRSILLQSMDLAAVVAAEYPDLASIFVETKRMSELVEAFAMSGRTILGADEMNMIQKMKGKGRRGHENELLGIWTVRRAEILKELAKQKKKEEE